MRGGDSRHRKDARHQGPRRASARLHDRILPAVLAGFCRAVCLRQDVVGRGRTRDQGVDQGFSAMNVKTTTRIGAPMSFASFQRAALPALLLAMAMFSDAKATTVSIVNSIAAPQSQ